MFWPFECVWPFSPETMRKLCLSTKFRHQKIRGKYCILRSDFKCISKVFSTIYHKAVTSNRHNLFCEKVHFQKNYRSIARNSANRRILNICFSRWVKSSSWTKFLRSMLSAVNEHWYWEQFLQTESMHKLLRLIKKAFG